MSNSVVACVPVRSSTTPVAAVTRPFRVAVATLACLALVTTELSIFQTVPLPVTVISPLSQSVRAGIVISPLPSREVELIVFIFVQDTKVACFPAISAASSLSVFNVLKLVFILPREVGFSVSEDAIVCSVLIRLLYVKYKLSVGLLCIDHSKFGFIDYPKSDSLSYPKSVLHMSDYLYKLFNLNLLHHSRVSQFLAKWQYHSKYQL